jgi:hypothetical protein
MGNALRLIVPALVVFPVLLSGPLADSRIPLSRIGDSVTVCVHRVALVRRADYDRWISRVSAPAFKRAGERFKSTRIARQAMRRLVPTQPDRDSILTYVYVWERPKSQVQEEAGKSTKAGYTGVFEDAGMSPAAIDSALDAFKQVASDAYCTRQVEEAVPSGN